MDTTGQSGKRDIVVSLGGFTCVSPGHLAAKREEKTTPGGGGGGKAAGGVDVTAFLYGNEGWC